MYHCYYRRTRTTVTPLIIRLILINPEISSTISRKWHTKYSLSITLYATNRKGLYFYHLIKLFLVSLTTS